MLLHADATPEGLAAVDVEGCIVGRILQCALVAIELESAWWWKYVVELVEFVSPSVRPNGWADQSELGQQSGAPWLNVCNGYANRA